jgi:hypothetical protein
MSGLNNPRWRMAFGATLFALKVAQFALQWPMAEPSRAWFWDGFEFAVGSWLIYTGFTRAKQKS